MSRQYSLHKKLVADVDRFMNEKKWRKDSNGHITRNSKGTRLYETGNLEKVILFTMQYLSLRLVHSDEISNEEIGYVVRKVNFGSEYEIPELYNILTKELTNQEFIFRIKRVKYLKNTADSLLIVASPLMKKLGKYMYRNTIRINAREVKLLEGKELAGEMVQEPGLNVEEPGFGIHKMPRRKVAKKLGRGREPDMGLCASDPELDRIRQVWDDREERDAWILKNVLSVSRKYGYATTGRYPAATVAKAVGVDQGTVLFYLRQRMLGKLS